MDRDLSAWRGNRMQNSALQQAFELGQAIRANGEVGLEHRQRQVRQVPAPAPMTSQDRAGVLAATSAAQTRVEKDRDAGTRRPLHPTSMRRAT